MSSMNVEAVKKAVKNSDSFSAAIKNLGLVPNGRANSKLQMIVAENNIDTSHFSQQSINRKKANNGKKSAATKKVVVQTVSEANAQPNTAEEFVLLNHTLDKVKKQVALSLTFSEAAARLGSLEVHLKRVVYKYRIDVSHFKTAAKPFLGLPDPPKTVTEVVAAKKADQESQTFAKTLYKPERLVEQVAPKAYVTEASPTNSDVTNTNLGDVWKKYEGKLAGPWEVRKVKGQDVYQRKASNGGLIAQVLVKGTMSFIAVFEKSYDEYYSLTEAQTTIDTQLAKQGFYLVPGENDPKGKLPEPSSIEVGVYKLGDNQSVIIKNGYLVIKEG